MPMMLLYGSGKPAVTIEEPMADRMAAAIMTWARENQHRRSDLEREKGARELLAEIIAAANDGGG